MNGIEILEKIKKDGERKDTPVVIFTTAKMFTDAASVREYNVELILNPGTRALYKEAGRMPGYY